MIPLHLTMGGILSYQDTQEIDFTRLHEAQLFGIFGAVGSGKSAILEAMTFALYDKSERLRSQDSRNYNLMNLKSDELLVRFTFRTFRAEAGVYRFEVSGKRSKKTFENVRTFTRRQFRQSGDEWIPVEADAEELLGLSYDNFRRTIIIPQGKFQEFLQLGSSDRNRMMKELFGLERFDLSARTASLQNRNTENVRLLEGRLKEVAEATPQALETLEEDLETLQKQDKELTRKIKKMSQEREALDRIALNRKALEEARARHDELKAQQEQMEVRQQQLRRFQLASGDFKRDFDRLAELQRQSTEQNSEHQETQDDINAARKELETLQTDVEKITLEYEGRSKILEKISELEQVSELTRLSAAIAQRQEQLEELLPGLESIRETLASVKTARLAVEEKIREAPGAALSVAEITQVSLWWQQQETLIGSIDRLERQKEKVAQELSDLLQERINWVAELPDQQWLKKDMAKLPPAELLSHVDSAIKAAETGIADLEAMQQELLVEKHLQQLAGSLKDGEPCPICGAQHHPSPRKKKIRGKDNTAAIDEQQHNLKQLQQLASHLSEQAGRVTGLSRQLETCEQDIADARRQLQQLAAERPMNKVLPERIDDIPRWLTTVQEDLQQGDQLKEEREARLAQEEQLRGDVEKQQQDVAAIQSSVGQLEAQYRTLAEQLRHYDATNPGTLPDDFQEEEEALKTEVENINRRFREMNERQEQLKKEVDRLEGRNEALQKQLNDTASAIKRVEKDITAALKKSQFEDLESVREVLALDLNVEKEQEDVLTWRESLKQAEGAVEKLAATVGEETFDPLVLQQLQNDLDAASEALQQLQKTMGARENQIENLQQDLKTRKSVEKDLKQLNDRALRLQTLLKMFRGSKFVNFVSGIFLRELCQLANERFQLLTRRQLALEVTEQNTFQVRDYLNDGRVRSINTLSGGQTFQASLCLALALADHVHQIAESEENFFFLDEGFGTLDEDALHKVFETLKTLRTENRTVGIISHVEALQQEIETALYVENDAEKGSRIRQSW